MFKGDPDIATRECHADTVICEFNAAGTVVMADRSTLVSIDGSLLQRCLDMTENDCPRDSESRLAFEFGNTTFTAFVSYLESGRTQVPTSGPDKNPLRSKLMAAIIRWELDRGLFRPDALNTTLA